MRFVFWNFFLGTLIILEYFSEEFKNLEYNFKQSMNVYLFTEAIT